MALDPPLVPSIVVKNAIENQVPAIEDIISPAPITVQLDGVRVKLNYDKYHELIENVVIFITRRVGGGFVESELRTPSRPRLIV